MAIVWGPLAGYFARQERIALQVVPLAPTAESRLIPFAYDISLGFRRSDQHLKTEVEQVLNRKQAAVAKILSERGISGVPVVAFLSHVQTDLAAAARAAGCDVLLARSAFTRDLPHLLEKYGGAEARNL